MKRKRRLGMGVSFKSLVSAGRRAMRKVSSKDINVLVDAGLAAAQKARSRSNRKPKIPRTIRVPKLGGFLQILPLITGLSAAGSLAGGVTGILKAYREIQRSKDQARVPVKVGGNIYLHAGKKGGGLYLRPYRVSKN